MTALDLDAIEASLNGLHAWLKQGSYALDDRSLQVAAAVSHANELLTEVATLRRVMLSAHRRLLEKADLTDDYHTRAVMVEIARDLRAEAGK